MVEWSVLYEVAEVARATTRKTVRSGRMYELCLHWLERTLDYLSRGVHEYEDGSTIRAAVV